MKTERLSVEGVKLKPILKSYDTVYLTRDLINTNNSIQILFVFKLYRVNLSEIGLFCQVY